MAVASEDLKYSNLSSVTDNEYFSALAEIPYVLDSAGLPVDVSLDVKDKRSSAKKSLIKVESRLRRSKAALTRNSSKPLGFAPSGAAARMQRIINRMRAQGLTVHEVDGWQSRGRDGSFAPKGVIEHHDASSIKSGNAGALPIIIKGRSDVPGPLAQFQVGRDGTWFIVAAGKSNHAGLGGPIIGIAKNLGNANLYGVEVANSGLGEVYSPALHNSLNRGFACILNEVDQPTSHLIGHKEWAPGRKTDPRHAMSWRRAQVKTVREGATPAPNPVAPQLLVAVNGVLDVRTVKELQKQLHVAVDGDMGPITIKALQRKVRATVDGDLGPATTKKVQAFVGVTVDGDWRTNTTKGVQRAINLRKFV